MTIIGPPRISGYTIFCDDIRSEIGGKFSLIGIYQGVMFVHGDFPFTLPKFGLLISYIEQVGACSHPLDIKVFMPGDTDSAPTMVANVNITELRTQALNKAGKANGTEEEETKYYNLSSQFIFSPLVIKQSGEIKIRAYCGEDIVRLGKLRVEKAPPQSG